MQPSNKEGFPKPREIIEITRTHELEAMDRAILDLLYRHAHDSGRLADPNAEFEIEMARLRPSKHEWNDRVREALPASWRSKSPSRMSTPTPTNRASC